MATAILPQINKQSDIIASSDIGNELQMLDNKIKDTSNEINHLIESQTIAVDTVKSANTDLFNILEQSSRLIEEKNSLQTQLNEKIQSEVQSKQYLKQLQEENESLKQQVKDFNLQKATFDNDKDSLHQQIQNQQLELTKLRTNHEQLKTEKNELSSQLHQIQQELQQKDESFAEERNKLTDLGKLLREENMSLQNKQSDIEKNIKDSLKLLNESNEELQKVLGFLRNDTDVKKWINNISNNIMGARQVISDEAKLKSFLNTTFEK